MYRLAVAILKVDVFYFFVSFIVTFLQCGKFDLMLCFNCYVLGEVILY